MTEAAPTVGVRDSRSSLKHIILRDYGSILLLAMICVIMGILNPRFLSSGNIVNLSKQMIPVGLVALGAMFVMISGGIDLSAGFGVSLSAVLLGVVYLGTNNLFLAILTAIVTGAIIGSINGLIITKLGLMPFIATLGTMSAYKGLTYIFSFGRMAWVKHPVIYFLGGGTVFEIPVSFIFLLIIYFVGYLILNRCRFGLYVMAIGSNEKSAILAGINVRLYKLYIYVTAGILTGLCSVILVSRLEMTAPTIGGISLLLDAIAATVIGGTSLLGGKGSVKGTFVGVVIITIIGNALNLLNVSPYYRDTFKGLVIIGAVFFDRFVSARGSVAKQ